MADEGGKGRKGGGSDPAAEALLAAVPAAFLRAVEADEGDPRDPPRARRAEAVGESSGLEHEPEDGPADERPAGSMLDILAQAQMAWLGGGVRYWSGLAELTARRGGRLADLARLTDGRLSEAEKLRLLDEARGWLREVGEISLREAQAMSDDMRRFEAALRRTQEKPPAKAPKRHGRPSR